MGVSGQLHALAPVLLLPSGKAPGTDSLGDRMGPGTGLDVVAIIPSVLLPGI
jgi:hypothetical protein